MAKTRKYKRRGKKDADSSYRKSHHKVVDSTTRFSKSKSERIAQPYESETGNDKVVGPFFDIESLMMTKRGKRIHLVDGNPYETSRENKRGVKDYIEDKSKWHMLSALCGAGRPNKEFPKGSAIPLYTKLSNNMDRATRQGIEDDGVQMTCYRCLKLQYMRDMADFTEEGNDVKIVERIFFPTNEGNRHKHIMVPAGRKGVFGANRDEALRDDIWDAIRINDEEGTIEGYTQYFAESRWTPGIEEQRTQPASLAFIGNRSAEEIKDLLEFTSKYASFGKLIQEALGTEVYSRLMPAGKKTDNDTAWKKLTSLLALRQKVAEQNYERASERGRRSKKSNPLLGLNEDLLDGIEMFVRRNYAKSRR